MLPLNRTSGNVGLTEINTKRPRVTTQKSHFQRLPSDLQASIFSYLNRAQFLTSVKALVPGRVGSHIVKWINDHPEHSLFECQALIKNIPLFLNDHGSDLTTAEAELPIHVNHATRLVSLKSETKRSWPELLQTVSRIASRLTHLNLGWKTTEPDYNAPGSLIESLNFYALKVLKIRCSDPAYFTKLPQLILPNLQKFFFFTHESEPFIKFFQALHMPLLEKLYVHIMVDEFEKWGIGTAPDDALLRYLGSSSSCSSIKSLTIEGVMTDVAPLSNSPYFTQLEALKLYSFAALQGIVEMEFPALRTLGLLYCYDDEFTSENPNLTSLRNLKILRAEESQIKDIFCSDTLTNLETLYLEGEYCPDLLRIIFHTDEGKRKLRRLHNLSLICEDMLNIEYPPIIETPSELSTDHLTHLSLHGLQCEHNPVLGWAQIGYLKTLDLSGCKLNDRHVEILSQSASLTGLRDLDLSQNDITGQSVLFLRRMTSLEHVFFRNCSLFGDKGAQALADWPILLNYQTLNLERCAISDIGFKSIILSQNARFLTDLKFDGNKLTDISVVYVYHSSLYRSLLKINLFHKFSSKEQIEAKKDSLYPFVSLR